MRGHRRPRIDLSATDPGAGEVLTYQADNLPPGASRSIRPPARSPGRRPRPAPIPSSSSASDGTTVTIEARHGRRRRRPAGRGRPAITAPYKPDTPYVESTLPAYNTAYADMVKRDRRASDDVFFQKLAALRTAAAGLAGSDAAAERTAASTIANMFFTSDFGTADARNLVDNSQGHIVGYSWRPEPDLSTWISAPASRSRPMTSSVQTVDGFPERAGGVAIFGSNDKENWIRLTPGLTVRIDDMQTLPVAGRRQESEVPLLQDADARAVRPRVSAVRHPRDVANSGSSAPAMRRSTS